MNNYCFPFYLSFTIFLLQCQTIKSEEINNKIYQGYIFSDWLKQNEEKITEQLSVDSLTSTLQILIKLPTFWDNQTISLETFLNDQNSSKIQNVTFINENTTTDYINLKSNISLETFMQLNCLSSYLDNEETIINKKCAVIIEFKYDDDQNADDDNSPFVSIKFGVSASINTQASVILKSVQLLEKLDCPCCNKTCEEDDSLPIVTTSMCLNDDCSKNTSEEQEINTMSLDEEIVYDFNIANKVRRNLADNSLTLEEVYAQDDNYALQLNDEIKIQTTDTGVQISVNASSIVFDLGKQFNLKMIFQESSSSDSEITFNKVRIVDSPRLNIKDIQIDSNSDDSSSSDVWWIVLITIISIGLVVIFILIIIQNRKRKAQKYLNKEPKNIDDQKGSLESQTVSEKTKLNKNNEG